MTTFFITNTPGNSETDIVRQFRPNVDYSFRTRRGEEGTISIELEKLPGFAGASGDPVELASARELGELFG